MEHVQPLERSFSWRAATLAVALLLVIALAAVGAIVLVDRLEGTRPVAATGRVQKRQVVTPLRPRSRISVLVLNGNGVAHAAGIEATAILGHGYRHAIPADAPSLAYARSLVLFRRGWGREAKRLARDAGIATVSPLDGRVAPPYGRIPLVVILGTN